MPLPAHVVQMLAKVAQREGFIRYEIEEAPGSKQGDGFFSVMASTILSGDRVNENGKVVSDKLHLLCKMAPFSKERRDGDKTGLLFEREIYLYTRVMPLFVKFQKEKGLKASQSFLSFPKVYATLIDEENEGYALIMDDLRAHNFVMWPRYEPTPIEHEKLILRQLARFHAISFAIKDQRPDDFAEFKDLFDVHEPMVEHGNYGKFISHGHQHVLDLIIDDDHKQIMQRLTDNYLEIMIHFFAKEVNDPFGVINHGDLWVNNILFKYDEANTKEIKNVSFLDWQICRYGSPAFDILCWIFLSTTKQFRDQHYDELIHVYYAELSETIERLGSDPEKLCKFSDLQNELKKCGPYALCMLTVFLLMGLLKPHEIGSIDEYYKKLTNGEKASWLNRDYEENDAIVIREMNGLVTDIIALGYDH